MQEQQKQLKKQLLITHLLGLPGTLMLGLGVYGVFIADGNGFHPFFDNVENSYYLLAAGVAISIWEAMRIIAIRKKLTQPKDKNID